MLGLWEGSPVLPLQGRDGTQKCCWVSSEQGFCCREPDLLNKLFWAAVLCEQPGNSSEKNWAGLARVVHKELHWRDVLQPSTVSVTKNPRDVALRNRCDTVILSLCLLRVPGLPKLYGKMMLQLCEFAEHQAAVPYIGRAAAPAPLSCM